MACLTRVQAVKYNGTGPAIPDLDDAVEGREGSDVDEDFISNDSSDESDIGIGTQVSSPRNLGKGGKRKSASKTQTPKTPKTSQTSKRKSVSTTNATQSTPSRRLVRKGAAPRNISQTPQTPSKLQPREQTAPKTKMAKMDNSQRSHPEPPSPSADLVAGLEETSKVLGQTKGRTMAQQTPQDSLKSPARPIHVQLQEQTEHLKADKEESSSIQIQSCTEDQPVNNRTSLSPHASDSTLTQTPTSTTDQGQSWSPTTMANTSPMPEA